MFVTEAELVNELHVAGGFVYWGAANAVKRIPVDGGTIMPLSSSAYVGLIRTSATDVYWSIDGGLLRVPLAGGTSVRILDDDPWGLALTPTTIVYAPVIEHEGKYPIRRRSFNGSSDTVLAAHSDSPPVNIELDGSNVYYYGMTESLRNDIFSVSLSGGAVKKLVSTDREMWDFKVDASYLYFVTPTLINRVSVNGGEVERVAEVSGPAKLAVDRGTVYFIMNRVMNGACVGRQISKVAATGGTPASMAEQPFCDPMEPFPAKFAQSEDSLFWIPDEKTIWRLAK